MSNQKKKTHRIIAILLITLGLVLAVSWNSTGFCIGDSIFTTLGLPTWSKGTSGTHYPAVIGTFVALIGISMLNLTLQEKSRQWVWATVILFFIALKIIISYI